METREDHIDDDVLLMDMEGDYGVDLTKHGVLSKLEGQDPGITSIALSSLYTPTQVDQFDFVAAGRAIRNSRCVKKLTICSPMALSGDAHTNIISFCREIASNTSIDWLYLSLDYTNYNFLQTLGLDSNTSTNDVNNEAIFEALFPFFENNPRLSKFSLAYRGSISIVAPNLTAALRAATTLKDICIEKFIGKEITTAEEELIHSMLGYHSLCRLSFNGNLHERGCQDLRNMLVHPECQLKYLELGQHLGNPSLVSSGLAQNKSVEHIVYDGKDCIIDSLHTLNHTLQKLDLSESHHHTSGSDDRDDVDAKLATVLPSLCALKSLKLDHRTVMTETLNAIITAVMTPTSELEELSLANCPHYGYTDGTIHGLRNCSLQVLESCMDTNKSLKSLNLSGANAITSDAWSSFFKNLQKSSLRLENIDLCSNNLKNISDEGPPDFIDFMKSCHRLKKIDLNDSISSTGWEMLLPAIHQTSIEELRVVSYKALYSGFPIALRDLLVNGNLRKLVLGSSITTSLESYRSVMSVLDSPRCCLEELSFACEFDNQEQLVSTMTDWAQSLSTNVTLKKLHVNCHIVERFSVGGIWKQFTNVLCNQDSIDATLCSNHTLQRLSIDFIRNGSFYDNDEYVDDEEEEDGNELPLEISSFLNINRNADKAAVSRRKVIMAHFNGSSGENTQKLIDFNFGLRKMPQLVHWIGKEQMDLTLMYDCIRSMSSLVDGAHASNPAFDAWIVTGKKRKDLA